MPGFFASASLITSSSVRTCEDGDWSSVAVGLTCGATSRVVGDSCASAGKASRLARRMNPNLLIDQSRQFERGMYLRRTAPERQRHFEQELYQVGAEQGLCRREKSDADMFRANFRLHRTSRQWRPGYDWPVRMGSGCLDLRLCCGRRPTSGKLATRRGRYWAVHCH